VGYNNPSDNTWEPRGNLGPNCKKIIKDFEKNKRNNKKKSRTKSYSDEENEEESDF